MLKEHTIPVEKREKQYTYSGCRTGINFLCVLNLSFVFQTFAPPVTFIFIASERVTSWEVSRLGFLRRSNYLSMVDSVSLSKCRSESRIWVYFQSIFIYYIQRCLRFMSEITPWGTRKAAFVEVLTGNKSHQSCDLLIFNSN